VKLHYHKKHVLIVNQLKYLEKYIVRIVKEILGRYNIKFYNEDKIEELLKTDHSTHVKSGHQISIRRFVKD